MSFTATLDVEISHVTGPEISDLHVIRWICADGAWFEGRNGFNGFNFEVCPTHEDPDECNCNGEVSIYRASIDSTDLSDPVTT